MNELGTKSKHASLLNDLYAMAQSFVYAARKHVLMQAEGVIVAQEREIERLRRDVQHWQRMYDCAQAANAYRQAALGKQGDSK